jgi:hypothetical protein
VSGTSLFLFHVKYDIRGSHGGEDVDVGLLGCNAMWTCRKVDINISKEHTASIFRVYFVKI